MLAMLNLRVWLPGARKAEPRVQLLGCKREEEATLLERSTEGASSIVLLALQRPTVGTLMSPMRGGQRHSLMPVVQIHGS
jgi:hypothetical protein